MRIRLEANRRTLLRGAIAVSLGLAIGLSACSRRQDSGTVVLASTTSLYDTGLLDSLVAAFEAEHVTSTSAYSP
jgi:ABC-type tungstate transport system permease subunit